MDDLKQYGKSLEELDSLMPTVRIYSNDIGMEFGVEKCAMIEMKRWKIIYSEGIQLHANSEKIKSLEGG